MDFRLRYLDLISKTILIIGLVSVGLLGISLLNYKTLPLVNAAVAGEEIPCPPGVVESSFGNAPFDAIAVFGGGFKKTDEGNWELNLLQKERSNAGAGLFDAGYLKTDGDVILLDGKLPDGASEDINKKYFEDEVARLSNNTINISPSHIIIDKVSVNTATNADELKKRAEEYNWKNILGVTHDYHRPRVELDTKIRGLCLSFMTVEEYTKMFNPSYIETLQNREESKGMKAKEGKEAWAILLHYLDPYWRIRILQKELINK